MSRVAAGLSGSATVFAETAGVIGLLASILVWISSYTAYLYASGTERARTHSKAKMRFQSFFMSTTVHLFAAAASSALSSLPKWDWRS